LKLLIKDLLIRFNYLFFKFFVKGNKNGSFRSVLILSPHPDDEIFGLGGFIQQILNREGKISIMYLTDGEGSGVWHDVMEIGRQRIALSEIVCTKLGIKELDVSRLKLKDGFVPQPGQPGFDDAADEIKKIIETVKPSSVFVTHTIDYWPFDHVAAAHLAKEAVETSEVRPELWYYGVWAWYNIKPWNLFSSRYKNLMKVDIRDTLKRKQELASVYLKAITPDGKPWVGVLPEPFLKTLNHPFELVERIL
jgi:LmbE family N-acetylglucosaminyl deacetylase